MSKLIIKPVGHREMHAALLLVNRNRGRELDGLMKMTLQANGLIEDAVQTKACKTCGTPRPDFHYLKITPAGRCFMGAMGLLADREKSE
jgi:hypothetical protein